MINKHSVSLGEAIAVSIGDKVLTPGAVVAGLAEASYSSAEYSDTGFRQEIVSFTENDPTQSMLLEETSTLLAEAIRDSFNNIKTYGVGLAASISDKVHLLYTPNRIRDVAHANLKVQFVNVDDPFFDSNLFPTAVRNPSFKYESVSLDMLKSLSFEYVTADDLLSFVNSTHPDVVAILTNPGWELTDAGNTISDFSALERLFVTENGLFNFAQVKSTDLDILLKMFVIVTKMATTDEPVKWLAKGEMRDYREFVNFLYNGMITYLLRLKQVVNTYKAQGATVFVKAPVRFEPSVNKDYDEVNILTGDVTVFYTDKALATIEQNGISFLEWVYAHQMSRIKQLNITTVSLLSDKALVNSLLAEYYGGINKVLVSQALHHFKRMAGEATRAFVLNCPELRDRILSLAGEGALADDWVIEELGDEFEKAYHTLAQADTTAYGELPVAESSVSRTHLLNLLISKTLVPAFLRVIGANLAADIMEDTYQTESTTPSEVQLRERVTVSVINLLARKTWS